MERPLVSKLNVQTMGKPDWLAPSMAHSASAKDDIVSTQATSAPPSFKALACSAKASMAASLDKVPIGSGSSPDGPIEPATITWRSVVASAILRAICAPAVFNSATRVAALWSAKRK